MAINKGLKLLAIRPIRGCISKIRRVLIQGQLYQFYNDYNFVKASENIHSDISGVEYKPQIPNNLYYIKRSEGKEELPIHISAIVGENGTGKSSVVELLYAACYNLAFKLNLLPEKDDEGRVLKLIRNLHVEIYYHFDDSYYRLSIAGDKLKLSKQKSSETQFKDIHISNIGIDFLRDYFFYTIAINYSHHALNANHLGHWVNHVFHKNDGYQTPVVINPYRNYGNIRTNNEERLTYSRLLSLLLTPQESSNSELKYYRELVPGKTAEEITISLNQHKVAFKDDEKKVKYQLDKKKKDVLDSVFKIWGINPPDDYDTKNRFIQTAYAYILRKVFTISTKYKPYKNEKFTFLIKDKRSGRYEFKLDIFNAFIKEIKGDPSHITFKFRQALNYLKYYREYLPFIGHKKKNKINDFAELINTIRGDDSVIDFLLPSFFKYNLYFKEGGDFGGLSSGEKQKIFSSTSYLYHIVNINSVKESTVYRRYRFINIIFDEIELYYHPELQRTFVKDFIDNIGRIEMSNIHGINCLFVTHSPFILSDIPNTNVLFLEEKAKPVDRKDTQLIETFGANIHDLLKNSFFLENGSMGQFAKERISETIDYLNLEIHRIRKPNANKSNDKQKNTELKEWEEELKRLEDKVGNNTDRQYHESVIRMIGEPILRKKLQSMYGEIATDNELDRIDKEIKDLEKKRELLKQKRNA